MDRFYELARGEQAYHTHIMDHLHRHPELSFQERATTRFIREKLTELGVEEIDLGMETGAVGLLRGARPGKTVLLRCDIDALALCEAPHLPVRSGAEGVMHACGHDLHTTCLLGAAKYFSQMREDLAGNIVFLFQPAEEVTEGMQAMLDHGLLEKLPVRVDATYALHCHDAPVGTVFVNRRQMMAAKTNFRLHVTGKIGHGSLPHKNIDPIVAAAAIISSAQTIVSRNTDPADEMICAICSVNTFGQDYFVTDKVTMSGTVRAISRETMHFGLRRLQEIAGHVAAAYRCGCSFEFSPEVPPCVTDPAVLPYALAAAEAVFGPEQVGSVHPALSTDDYGLLCSRIPSCYFFLGIRPERDVPQLLHTETYQVSRDAIPYGIALLMRSALLTLQGE